MAADILIYDADVVPVGQDQKQHVEVTRDLANKFNDLYGETFVVPEPRIRRDVAKVPGIDGAKMSKSYNNTVDIFGAGKAIKKRIMSIVMDSRTREEPKPDAEENNAILILKHVADEQTYTETLEALKAGGFGYGDLKKKLFECYWEHFAPARQKREELLANLDYVDEVLAKGAEKARSIASKVNKRARAACGLE